MSAVLVELPRYGTEKEFGDTGGEKQKTRWISRQQDHDRLLMPTLGSCQLFMAQVQSETSSLQLQPVTFESPVTWWVCHKLIGQQGIPFDVLDQFFWFYAICSLSICIEYIHICIYTHIYIYCSTTWWLLGNVCSRYGMVRPYWFKWMCHYIPHILKTHLSPVSSYILMLTSLCVRADSPWKQKLRYQQIPVLTEISGKNEVKALTDYGLLSLYLITLLQLTLKPIMIMSCDFILRSPG